MVEGMSSESLGVTPGPRNAWDEDLTGFLPQTRSTRFGSEGERKMVDVEGTLSARDAHSREAAHRTKNHLALVASMLRMQARRVRPELAPRQFETMANRVAALAQLYDQLTVASDAAQLDLCAYFENLVERLRTSLSPEEPAEIRLETESCTVPSDLAVELGLIVTELVTNAIKHGRSADGRLRVTIACRIEDGTGELVCSDAGTGLPDDHETRAGLGMHITRALVSGIAGKMTINSSPAGTGFIIRFPVR